MPFTLFSAAFPNGAPIPSLHSRDGADVSPSFEWSGEPAATLSFALVVDDPDAPAGTWTHWLLYDIPPTVHTLAQGYKPGALGVSGKNSFGAPGYGGPYPPKGHGPHRYFFKLHALDVPTLGLPAGATPSAVHRALQVHVLAEAHYMGRYERQ
jgi:Raf kinase inhibitor-like YbhB/YbcL family protein